MRAEIRGLQKKLGATIVYVTHDQIEAMTMADKIVVMRGGHVEQIGSPLELYDRPVNTFVAGFIGSPSMNLISGRIDADGATFVSNNGFRLDLRSPVGVPAGKPVVLGVRPEAIEFAETGIAARVRIVEPTGAELHVILDAPGEELTTVIQGRRAVEEGANVSLALAHEALHFFDEETGERIDVAR
jgi:multiple sugar transport system ATP-binding protein